MKTYIVSVPIIFQALVEVQAENDEEVRKELEKHNNCEENNIDWNSLDYDSRIKNLFFQTCDITIISEEEG